MEDELITIARFLRIHEAYEAKLKLESIGIECFIPDEMYAKNFWFHLGGVGGVRLQVKEKDAAKALEILEKETSD
jgi:hypothetical protein